MDQICSNRKAYLFLFVHWRNNLNPLYILCTQYTNAIILREQNLTQIAFSLNRVRHFA